MSATTREPVDAVRLRALVVAGTRADADEPAREALRRHLEALFAEHHDRLFGVCLRLCGDAAEAADLAQDTLLTACARIGDYRGEGAFGAWLSGIARHRWMSAGRNKRDLLADDHPFDPRDPARSVMTNLRANERRALLQDAIRSALDPMEQEAVTMRYELGMSVDRIKGLLGLTYASGARGLLQTCRRKLRRELARRLAELGHGESLLFDSVCIE